MTTTNYDNPSCSQPSTLPKTIEGATQRYLESYKKQFKGPIEEGKRLASYADARILRLRTKAPTFYQDRLPKLLNQAASTILTFDTETKSGRDKFNETHAHFLRVLDELKKSQPVGEVDFQDELDRTIRKEELKKKHLQLREKIDNMESVEFDIDELGEEEVDSACFKMFSELERDKVELRRIATLIAKMEGEQIEEEIKFELKVVPNSALDKLSCEQLNELELLMDTFYLENNRNQKAMYMDKSIIDGMLDKLKIDTTKFTKVELNQLSKDALDAYRTFFRDIHNKKRNEYHEHLINSHHLRPKDGLILENPDDVPEEIRQKLLESEQTATRKLNECCELYSEKQALNEDVGDDAVYDEDGNASSGDDDAENIYIQKNSWLFNRIKEEPREDYENDAPSEDEMIVHDRIASRVESALGQQDQEQQGASTSDEGLGGESTSDQSEAGPSDASHETLTREEREPDDGDTSNYKKPKREDSTEDDFQLLGIVEPTDKIDCITIDDDD